jgi:hypothetical protein
MGELIFNLELCPSGHGMERRKRRRKGGRKEGMKE